MLFLFDFISFLCIFLETLDFFLEGEDLLFEFNDRVLELIVLDVLELPLLLFLDGTQVVDFLLQPINDSLLILDFVLQLVDSK